MKIKVLSKKNKYPTKGSGGYLFSVRFKIAELEDEEILKISQISPISINMNPMDCGLKTFSYRPVLLGTEMKWAFKLKSDRTDLINFEELENIELNFSTKDDADKYKEFILLQFTDEINRINNLDNIVEKEELYEINAEEGIKKIYEGAEKVLDKNSLEYKEIVEKNRGAWKKLADL